MTSQRDANEPTSRGDSQMALLREKLQDALYEYTSESLEDADKVGKFCARLSEWINDRENDLKVMNDIKDRSQKIDTKSKSKGQAFLQFAKNKMSLRSASSRRAELEKELAAALKDTLGGLEELHCFLDAVERLAVTSLHVFSENQVLRLPTGISPEDVQVIIIAARLICPLLLEFKRDAKAFFLPKLQNVEVLSYQLDRYIRTTQKICNTLEKSVFSLEMTEGTEVNLDVYLAGDIQKMLNHINKLDEIRKNQSFRMVFLFQEEPCYGFIWKFRERQPKMLQFLNDLEENAVQLDRMNYGSKISSVAGRSVGVVGGVLSIIGLALSPVTAGVSLALTMTVLGLKITRGVNSVITTATKIGVNRKHQKKASEIFQSFMEDVQSVQSSLEEVTKRGVNEMDVAVGVTQVLRKAVLIGKRIYSLVKMMRSEELVPGVGKVVAQEGEALHNVPRVASDIPDIGQAAVEGPLALSESARGLFAALFLGMDIFSICKDSISLAKGSETEVSQFIRARAKLWSSEMDSWQRIHDSLCDGLLTSEKDEAVLETPFYPEMGAKQHQKEENETGIQPNEVEEKLKEKLKPNHFVLRLLYISSASLFALYIVKCLIDLL